MKTYEKRWLIFIIVCCYVRENMAQVCTESGRIAGLEVKPRQGFDFRADHTIILDTYGGINCYGVVKEWKFYRSPNETNCAEVDFQIWRPTGATFELVGFNRYDPVSELCTGEEGEVLFRIPQHEQIPVQPDDVIGWTSNYQNEMIEYETGSDEDPVQGAAQVCKDPGDDPTNPGFNTQNCTAGSTVYREVSLQVLVVTGPVPVFENLPQTIEIPENSIPGNPSGYPNDKLYDVKASIEKNVLNNATDVDLVFSFVNPEKYFDISTLPNDANQPYTGRVEITTPLDYESQTEHIIPIRVEGLGLYNESYLIVKVIDLNEPHVISNLDFSTQVNAESGAVGDIVFEVEVFDDDINPDPLYYAVHSTDNLDPPPPFKMENSTGILRVAQDLYGVPWANTYTLNIIAWDFMHESVKELTIDMINVRTAPVIANLDETIDVPENAPTDSDIFQVTTVSRVPEEIRYHILGVTPFELYDKFYIDAISGWIKTTSSPDFDYGNTNHKTIEIQVAVSDSVGSDSGILTINLIWVNRGPVFIPDVYSASLPEKCGEDVSPNNCLTLLPWEIPDLTLNFEHRDENVLPDDGGQVDASSCKILNGFASDLFSVVNCKTMYVTESLDLNSNPEYASINLTVQIDDLYGLSDIAQVYLTVYDINDHRPIFSPDTYFDLILENTEGGMSLLQVSASDDDFGENASLTYSLDDNPLYNGSFYFQIDPSSGEIFTKHPVDYERLMTETSNSTIHFYAVATDNGINQKSSTANVYVTIEDVNDNRPVYDCQSERKRYEPIDPDYQCFYNLDTRSDTLVGYSVLELTAYDEAPTDLQANYYILNPKEHFALNTTNNKGDLHTNSTLLVYHKYMMICMVEDQGIPVLKARPPVITRVDTFPPEKHLVDITLDVLVGDFNSTTNIELFMYKMADFIEPWYPRLNAISGESDRSVVTIYALTDNSTFLYENLDKPKQFVHVNDLLKRLRDNLFGDPTKEFEDEFLGFKPVLVNPTLPNWWRHTLGGLITGFLLILLLLTLIILAIVFTCRYFALCCFSSRRNRRTEHAWMYDKSYLKTAEYQNDTIAGSEYDSSEETPDDIDTVYPSTSRNEQPEILSSKPANNEFSNPNYVISRPSTGDYLDN